MNVYLDNAATTAIDPEVIEAMIPVLRENYGNPSSIHTDGRIARSLIEKSRKSVAKLLNCSPAELFFTSGGTEADNMVLRCAVDEIGVDHIITSKIEHHAILHTAEELAKRNGVELSFVKLDEKGKVDLEDLDRLLKKDRHSLVSLMHGNNEIANLLPLKEVGAMCQENGALFHSDTVQTMAHYDFDLSDLQLDFATCSAHKFHGPKGIGFLYIKNTSALKPLITGGAQESNMRAGTENIYGIVGLAKALELAYENLPKHQAQVGGLKMYMIQRLKERIPGIEFNGDSENPESLYTVLSACFPSSEMDEMFLYHLDIEGISVSGGSACSSGSNTGSHVLRAIQSPMDRPSVRFSFGRFNTKSEIDKAVEVVSKIYSSS